LRALIVADGDVPAALPDRLAGDHRGQRPLIVAADGGALKAERLGLRPDIVVGDLDSLSASEVERLRQAGIEVLAYSRAKDHSDLELAVREAIGRGASELVIVGALGGRRYDHALANTLLLALPELAAIDVVLIDGEATLRVIGSGGPDRLVLTGTAGDLVSLLPLSPDVQGVTTDGLLYPLADEALRQGSSRGLSNIMLAGRAEVSTRDGRLAIVHSPCQLAEGVDG
jgi:thiamine pyrophosphokinase